MKKVFTKALMAAVLLVSIMTMSNAQRSIWPLATDSATIRASQFADTNQIYWSRTGALRPPTGHKGWITKGITSDDPAKKDSSRWVWKSNSTPTGAYYTGRRMGSPSTLNGCAIFNSDFLDTKGIAGNFGAGESPSPHIGELISPMMDASGATDIVVQFNQYYRQFQSATYIQYSVDSGATWSSRFNLNTTIAVNSATLNPVIATNTDSTLMRVTLFGSVGTNKFMIKFVFDGDFYFWCVDDVKVLDWKLYDMQMSTFYALPPSLYTPVDQLEPMRFLADVSNKGNKAMNNTKLYVKVWQSSTGALVYSDSTAQYPASFKADSTIENRLLPKAFVTSGLTPGIYVGSYRIRGDSSALDINPANDTVRFSFAVSDMSSTTAPTLTVAGVGSFNYVKENATAFSSTRNADSYWTATEPKSWRVGNYYRIVKGKTAQISTVAAVLNAQAAAGRTLAATVYEWKDVNDDGVVQATERNLVAVADTTLPATQPASLAWFFFRMKDLTTNKSFQTKDTTNYLVMIEFDAPAPAATPLYLSCGFSRGAYDYQGMRYVTDSVGAARYTIVLGKTTDSDWSTAGYGGSDGGTITPTVRINILPFRVNTNDLLSDENKMDIFPNPTGADFININVDLAKQADAAIRVMSVEGRFMAEQVIDKLDNLNIRLDIHDYPAGTYIAQILTADGIMSRRFVVTK